MPPLVWNTHWITVTAPYYTHFQTLRAIRKLLLRIKEKEPLPEELRHFILTEFLPTIAPPPELTLHQPLVYSQEAYKQFEEKYYEWRYRDANKGVVI